MVHFVARIQMPTHLSSVSRMSVKSLSSSSGGTGDALTIKSRISKTSAAAIARDACTCGLLSTIGDAIAQRLAITKQLHWEQPNRSRKTTKKITGRQGRINKLKGVTERNEQLLSWLDSSRSFRMGSFGLIVYGPLQHWWYRALKTYVGQNTIRDFAAKVTLNQILLGPVVCASVFTWTLMLQRKHNLISAKIKRDLLPTMIRGWKFWVPASSVNFWLIPIQYQVLYMSACGVVWNYILSTAAN